MAAAHLCLLAIALWVAVAVASGLARPSLRGRLHGATIIAGIPLTGWTTYEWGPGVGTGAILLGVLLLAWADTAIAARARSRIALLLPRFGAE